MRLLRGQFLPSTDVRAGWGQNRIVKVANPAAGKDWEVTVPGGMAWRLATVRYIMKTSAQAANRVGRLAFAGAAHIVLAEQSVGSVIAASLTTGVNFLRGFPGVGVTVGTTQSSGLPELVLEAGWTVKSSVDVLQTEDQLEGIVLWVEEFEVSFDHTIEKAVEDLRKAETLEEAFTRG